MAFQKILANGLFGIRKVVIKRRFTLLRLRSYIPHRVRTVDKPITTQFVYAINLKVFESPPNLTKRSFFHIYFATRSASSSLTDNNFETPSCPIVTP